MNPSQNVNKAMYYYTIQELENIKKTSKFVFYIKEMLNIIFTNSLDNSK